jgi:hypothetical protein
MYILQQTLIALRSGGVKQFILRLLSKKFWHPKIFLYFKNLVIHIVYSSHKQHKQQAILAIKQQKYKVVNLYMNSVMIT